MPSPSIPEIGAWVVTQELVAAQLYQGHNAHQQRATLRVLFPEQAEQLALLLPELQRQPRPGLALPRRIEHAHGAPVLVMAPVDGRPLSAVASSLALGSTVRLAQTLTDVLQSAHDSQLAFGGLRDTEILVDTHGAPTLCGIPQRIDGARQAADLDSLRTILRRLLTRHAPLPAVLQSLVSGLEETSQTARWPLSAISAALHVPHRSEDTLTSTEDSMASWAPSPPPVAESLGRYTLQGKLGTGGMGVVYRAYDPQLDRVVALKVLLPQLSTSQEIQERFLLEARATAKLEHPGVIRIYDFGEYQGQFYFTMQLVAGPSMAKWLGRRPRPPQQAAQVIRDVAHALAAAHQAGLVHRDIKPHNILMEDDHTPILMDFGLVKALEVGSNALTLQGQLLGTPAYMAPEQALGEPVGTAADIYALGAVLYETLAGRPPYQGASPMAIVQQVRTQPPAPLRTLDPALPPTLATICHTAMARTPADRYPSAAAFAADLDRFLSGAAIQAQPRQPARRWLRPVIGVLVVLGIAAGAVAFLQHTVAQQARSRREAAAEARRVPMAARAAALRGTGESDEAQALVDSFVAFEENQETNALAQAWLDEARHHQRQGTNDNSLTAYANAYALAADSEIQKAALLGLAQAAREVYAWNVLYGVIRRIDERFPELADTTAPLRRDVDIYFGDLDRARGGPMERITSALAGATPTSRAGDRAMPWDYDQDGVADLALWHKETARLAVVDPRQAALPVVAQFSTEGLLSPMWRPFPVGDTVAFEQDNVSQLYRSEGSHLVPAGSLPTQLFAIEKADMDRDGLEEIYVGAERRLETLHPQPDGRFERRGAHTGTNLNNSEIRAVRAGDFDQDGQLELAVATSVWGSYDLRVFEWDPVEGLVLSARERLGHSDALGVVNTPEGLLLVIPQKQPPSAPFNTSVFHPELAPVPPSGLYLFRYTGSALTQAATIPVPVHMTHSTLFLDGGDLDGDGSDELIWTVITAPTSTEERYNRNLHVFSLEGGVPVHDFVLKGHRALSLQQMDADPAMELLVSVDEPSSTVWVLGAGDTALVPSARPDLPVQDPPAEIDDALRLRWRRAEDLIQLGFPELAAERLVRLSQLAAGTPTEHAATLRAAELYRSLNHHVEAAELYARAADAPAQRSAALESARQHYASAADLAQELVVTEQILAIHPKRGALQVRAAELREWLYSEPTVLLDGDTLHPAWRIDTPVGLRLAPDGLHLGVDAPLAIMDMPVEVFSPLVTLEVEYTPQRLDWGERWRLGLSQPGATKPALRLEVNGSGGGGHLNHLVQFIAGGFHLGSVGDTLSILARRLRTRLELDLQRRQVIFSTFDGETLLDRRSTPLSPTLDFLGESPTTLQLATDAMGTGRSTIHRVSVHGLRPALTAPSAEQAAHRLLAQDRPAEAAAALPAPSPGLAAILAEEQGLPLPPLLLSEALQTHLLRAAPQTWVAPLRAALGDAYYPLFWRTWRSTVSEDRTAEVFTRHLKGLASLPLDTFSDPRDASSHLGLLFSRSRAWNQRNRLTRARADLDRAALLADALLAQDMGPRRGNIAVTKAKIQVSIARLLIDTPDEAMATVLRSLETAPNPELIADLLVADPDLVPLRDHPAWDKVEALRH